MPPIVKPKRKGLSLDLGTVHAVLTDAIATMQRTGHNGVRDIDRVYAVHEGPEKGRQRAEAFEKLIVDYVFRNHGAEKDLLVQPVVIADENLFVASLLIGLGDRYSPAATISLNPNFRPVEMGVIAHHPDAIRAAKLRVVK